MVEFVVVGMVLLLLLLGTIQFALIYNAKITLNYAAFETARAGAVNNARMWAMELAFARALAPLYTTPYVTNDSGDCESDFSLGDFRGAEVGLELSSVQCARDHVKQMLAEEYVRILLVNPREESFFGGHGVTVGDKTYIPNDNLMYRSAYVDPISQQSIQDANLIKVHVALCYKLVVPMVDRIISRLVGFAPSALEPANFGPAEAGSFSGACSTDEERYAIPLYAQAVMRMQSDPVLDTFCAGQCS